MPLRRSWCGQRAEYDCKRAVRGPPLCRRGQLVQRRAHQRVAEADIAPVGHQQAGGLGRLEVSARQALQLEGLAEDVAGRGARCG